MYLVNMVIIKLSLQRKNGEIYITSYFVLVLVKRRIRRQASLLKAKFKSGTDPRREQPRVEEEKREDARRVSKLRRPLDSDKNGPFYKTEENLRDSRTR